MAEADLSPASRAYAVRLYDRLHQFLVDVYAVVAPATPHPAYVHRRVRDFVASENAAVAARRITVELASGVGEPINVVVSIVSSRPYVEAVIDGSSQ